MKRTDAHLAGSATGPADIGRGALRIVVLLVALVITAVGAVHSPPAAHAQPIGTLLVVPGEGTDLVAPRLRTSRGCPAEANAYYARMFGPGIPAEGLVVTTNISAGISFTAGFDAYFGQTFRDFGRLNNIPVFSGRYDLLVSCIDKFASRVKGEFTGALEFTEPTVFRAIGDSMPVGTPPPPIEAGDGISPELGLNPIDPNGAVPAPGDVAPLQGVPAPEVVPDGEQAAPGVDPSAAALAPGENPPAAGQTVQDGAQVVPRSNSSSTSYLPLVLIGLLVVVPGVIAVVSGVRRRRNS